MLDCFGLLHQGVLESWVGGDLGGHLVLLLRVTGEKLSLRH